MAIPPLIRRLIQALLTNYCQKKIPSHVSDRVRLDFQIRGNNVRLIEKRPRFRSLENWVETCVAQMRYQPNTGKWALYWADRNSRWHPYNELSPQKDFANLLAEIDEDPTCIFWG